MLRFIPALLVTSALLAQTHEEVALRISADIQSRHIPFGTILNPVYAAADSEEIVTYSRCGDSAIWTGHWLAAESFRYRVTRSTEALSAARLALRGIQLLVNATGAENLLARCVVRADSPLAAGPRTEERQHGEYAVSLDGTTHYWIGDTSRDQYMGVFFGLSTAYEHIEDAAVRATIADLTTRLIGRLLDKDWAIVMPGGAISTVFWLRPDQQLAILQVGRQVNPTRFSRIYEDRRRSATGLETIMSIEAQNDHDSYFKFNLAAITFFNLVRLEERGSPKIDSYLQAYQRFRRAVAGHGNLFFNVIDRALEGANAQRDSESMELLAAWLLRPRRDARVDLRGKYKACGDDRACEPIPVPERVRTDFLWQRSPFLLYGGGDGTIEAPGIDFILPYWMGRYYDLDFNLMVLSAASGSSTLAPASIASLYGGPFAAGSRVELRDAAGMVRSASVLFAAEAQINFVMPPDTSVGTARITILRPDGSESHSTVADVRRVAPALFTADATGRGPAAALAFRVAQNGTQTPVAVFRCAGTSLCFLEPIELDEATVYLSLYGTGIRGAHGQVLAKVDEEPVPVLYAGPQSEFDGLDQVNIRLDRSVRTRGERNLTVFTDESASNPVRILLR